MPQPNYSTTNPNALSLIQQMGSNQGDYAAQHLKGLMGSDFFGMMQQFGQGMGGSQFGQYQNVLQGNPAYQGLIQQGQMPWEQYYGKVGGQLDQLYGQVSKQAQGWLDSANPSGVGALNAQQLMAQGMAPVQQQARAAQQQLGVQGQRTGGMSGTSALAAMLPSHMMGAAGGQVATQASLGAHQSELQRGALNAQMKGQALGTLGQVNAAKAGQLGGMLAQHASIGQNAYMAALQALAQILGIEASQAPKFAMSFGASDNPFVPGYLPQFSMSQGV